MNIIQLNHVKKSYFIGRREIPVLSDITLNIRQGEFVAFMGPSGSGKSTLLHLIGALDRPTAGEIIIQSQKLAEFDDQAMAHLRNIKIGFVFQDFFLLPYYSALENVCLPLFYAGTLDSKRAIAQKLLAYVGLGSRIHHKPTELSGGEQQRVAIARALINQPAILCADEPTGNLDSQNGAMVMSFLREINANGTTVVLITHDNEVAKQANRILHMQDGCLYEEK